MISKIMRIARQKIQSFLYHQQEPQSLSFQFQFLQNQFIYYPFELLSIAHSVTSLISIIIIIIEALMSHNHTSSSVYYDYQKDVYFKIDKKTGRQERSYKNGTSIKTFKLDVSGSDYKKRRQDERFVPSLPKVKVSMKRIKALQAASQKNLTPFQEHQPYRINRPLEKQRNNISSQRVKSQENQSNFLTSFNPLLNNASERKRNDQMTDVLKQFCKLNNQKVLQNHSPFDKAQGTVRNTDSLLNNEKGFRQTKNIIYLPTDIKRRKQNPPRATSQQSQQSKIYWNRQLSKEKKLFLEFHPVYQQRENVKAVNEQIDRKINIKKLEKLFLEQTGKITNQIYS